jgi:hypothetical protein
MPVNSRLLYELAVPRTSYAQKANQKRAELQYQNIMLQQEQLQTKKQEEGLAAIQDTMLKLNTLPLESPDKVRMSKYIAEKKAELSKHITDNYQDVGAFLKNGSQQWSKNFFNEVVASDAYLTGVKNTAQVALAREAIKKGEVLLGSSDGANYSLGEKKLADYYEGKGNFTFNGSYEPSKLGKEMRDYFGKIDNPKGKYSADSTVPPEQMQSFLAGINRPEAIDYMNRNKGASFNYKTYSPEDAQLFKVDIQSKQAAITNRNASTNLINKKISEVGADIEGGNESFFSRTFKQGLGKVSSEISATLGNREVIPGMTLMQMGSPDRISKKQKLDLTAYDMGSVGKEILNNNGIQVAKFSQGKLTPQDIASTPKKGFTMGTLARPINIEGLNVGVLSYDNKVYRPDGLLDLNSGKHKNKDGTDYNDGLVKLKLILDSSGKEKLVTQMGKGSEKLLKMIPSTQNTGADGKIVDTPIYFEFEGFFPVKDITNNTQMNVRATKGSQGVKTANETDYTGGIFNDSI